MPDNLTSGDKVIVLAGAARTAAVVAGAFTTAIVAWAVKHSVLVSAISFFGGGIVGFLVGRLVGGMMFPSQNENVMVAKCGLGALPLLLQGNILSGLATAVAVCGLMTVFLQVDFAKIIGPSTGLSVLLGVLMALGAALL